VADRSGPNPGHELHDRELIALAAGGDAPPAEAGAANALVTSCGACAALHDDLRLLALATRRLRDVPVAAPRDFRLAPADAARLRRKGPAGLLSRWSGFGGSAFRARVGTGLVAAGLVGVLLSAATSGLLGGIGGAATSSQAGVDKETNFGAAAPAPAATDTSHLSTTNAQPRDDAAASSAQGPGRTAVWLAVVGLSLMALVVGIGILLAARHGRRAGP
jgi:hypothetical protein